MSARPLTIGLTGGVGSGKTAVAKAFEALGVPVVCTDSIARALVEPGQPALREIVEHFGADMLRPGGKLDRAAMRQRVFADADSRRALEGILHPRIRDEVTRRVAAATGAPYVVIDIPLLAETGASYRALLDRIVVVECDAEVRRQRVMLRDGVDAEQAAAMLAAQASDQARRALADDIIVNEGSLAELANSVLALDRKFRRLAGA